MTAMQPPPMRRLAGEIGTFLRRPFWAPAHRGIAQAHPGDGRVVLVIPGFLARDILTGRLRRTLDAAGYRSATWDGGMNRGVSLALMAQLEARLAMLVARSGRPIAIVGWSLGGLYARELARRRPQDVERVITLGSPFSGSLRANRAWRLYERVNGYPVDHPPFPVAHGEKPPVPTFALWSPIDGIVAPESSRGAPGEVDFSIAVACRHMDFVSAPSALAAILAALAIDTGTTAAQTSGSDRADVG